MNVGELCNREVVIAGPGCTLLEAARRMRELHVGDLVVVEDSNGTQEPVGVVTDRDLVVEGLAVHAAAATMVRVSEVMTAEIVVAEEREDIHDVLRRMRSAGVRRMPVVDGRGGLVGIITSDDILEWMSEQLSELFGIVRREQVVERVRTGTVAGP